MKKAVTIFTALVMSFLIVGQASAYTVKSGDTMGGIAEQHGISLSTLIEINPDVVNPNMIYIGQNINTVTNNRTAENTYQPAYEISQADKELMARLVRAEAVGEPYAGKVAVATVVINRLKHSDFPNTIQGVIYETYSNGKYYAFSPVMNGEINKPYGAEEMKAVEEAINFAPYSSGSLFFYNPRTATSEWIFTRETTVVIGNHVFAK
jgi:N-acetylmuramoyl-L-alanine amidase